MVLASIGLLLSAQAYLLEALDLFRLHPERGMIMNRIAVSP
jgi:hypothetical protein